MARQYLFHNGQQIPLNGQDFWVGTHEQFANANPPIPKGTLLYFDDGKDVIKKASFTATTTSSGNASPSTALLPSAVTILSAICTNRNGTIVTVGLNSSGQYMFHCTNTDGTSFSSTSVTIQYVYM